ncbi:MAG: hypothetical protein HY720_21435 [Planctomycetes bacterium]|nr:hypothetical protein [Planctomycetota bacterium]
MNEKPSRREAIRYHREATEALERGEPEDALALLSFAFERDPDFRPAYETAVAALEELEHVEEADLFRHALDAFDDPRALYRLGYHFFDEGHTRLAVPFLSRSDRLRPLSPDTLIALAVSLAAEGRFRECLKTLERHPELETQFWPYHEYAYANFLLGRIDRARTAVRRIRAREDSFRATVTEDETADFEASIERLEGGLARYGRVPERDDASIRDWHFIQYGAALLERFDDRFGPGAGTLAGGRFLSFHSSPGLVRGVLDGLVGLLGQLGIAPATVLFAPDDDSEILALALGVLLDLPVDSIDDALDRQDSLVVAASSEALNDFPEIADREAGETLFAYQLLWTRDCLVVPDVSGLLAQLHVFPWQETHPDLEEPAFDIPADPRPFEEIAHWILEAAPFPPPASREEDFAFYVRHRADLAAGDWIRRPHRERYLTNSPIPGWRYA